MTIIDYKKLREIKKREIGKKIIYCSGTFDLLHAGHVLFFEDCKKYAEVLVVGVGNDATIKRYKGEERPILNEDLRLKMVDSLKVVNYCFLDNPLEKNENSLFSPLKFIFSELRPDFYLVNKDIKKQDLKYRKQICKEHGVKMVISKRYCPPEYNNISTSKIIQSIKRLNL